jgi:LAO/AO transport system kinase
MEIGDIFVINKADREGVLKTEKEVEALLSLAMRPDAWQPPILKTVATEGKGIADLMDAIERYSQFHQTADSSDERRRGIARWRILELLRERLIERTLGKNGASEKLEMLAAEVAAKRRDPYSAVDEIIESSGQ